MTTQSSRRAFLRGAFAAPPAMRPFGAGGDVVFEEQCTRCGDCLTACPENVLTVDRDGLPVFDAGLGACTFCGDCIAACAPGALVAGRPWNWRARADASCLSRGGVQCRACQDHCDVSAIRFRLMPGGRAEPQFDTDSCTGCGECVAPCPVNAIGLIKPKQEVEALPC